MDFTKEYVQKGLIKAEQIGFDQVIQHLGRAKQDLVVAKANFKIDSEASYNYAYLAMLRTGRGLMLSCGFRPVGAEQHKTVVSFCENILGREFADLTQNFNRMRKKRNRFTYDDPGLLVTETETASALKNASDFVEKVIDFIQKRNPQKVLF